MKHSRLGWMARYWVARYCVARCRTTRHWMVCCLAALACFGGSVRGEGSESLDIATRLIEGNPTELAELEAIFGAFSREWMDGVHRPIVRTFGEGPIERVELSLSTDLFHKDPADPDQSLADWRVVFRDSCPQIHRLLEEKLGAPSRSFYQLPYGVLAFLAPFVDRCALEWRRFEPEQVPVRSEALTRELRAALVRLLSRPVTRSRIEQLFGPLAFDDNRNEDSIERATWSLASRPAGSEDPEEVMFSFRPSLPATDGLLAALGLKRTVVVSSDVHVQSRQLVKRRGFAVPRVRGREIRIELADVGLEPVQLRSRQSPPLTWHAEIPQIIRIRMVKVGDRR